MRKLKITFNAPAVLIFTGICLFATAIGDLTGGRITEILFMTYRGPLASPMTYLRLFTHVFGHAGWAHFIGNTSYLLLLGPLLEEKYGTSAIVEIIAITAFVTGLVNNILFPNVGLCGASGVVFAFILLASFTNFREGELPITFILVAIIYIGQQVVQGVTMQDDISNMAHIVGGMVGAFIGYKLNKGKAETSYQE